jgi:hypothetical protein
MPNKKTDSQQRSEEEEAMKCYSVRLSNKLTREARKIGEGNISEGIRKSIKKYNEKLK